MDKTNNTAEELARERPRLSSAVCKSEAELDGELLVVVVNARCFTG